MGEMMERIARAIYEATSGPYEFASEDGKRVTMLEARAAVAAMREPSEAMINAADSWCPTVADGDNWTAPIWYEMIDALLTEGGRTGEKG